MECVKLSINLSCPNPLAPFHTMIFHMHMRIFRVLVSHTFHCPWTEPKYRLSCQLPSRQIKKKKRFHTVNCVSPSQPTRSLKLNTVPSIFFFFTHIELTRFKEGRISVYALNPPLEDFRWQ